jgi:hypothetical protein
VIKRKVVKGIKEREEEVRKKLRWKKRKRRK